MNSGMEFGYVDIQSLLLTVSPSEFSMDEGNVETAGLTS